MEIEASPLFAAQMGKSTNGDKILEEIIKVENSLSDIEIDASDAFDISMKMYDQPKLILEKDKIISKYKKKKNTSFGVKEKEFKELAETVKNIEVKLKELKESMLNIQKIMIQKQEYV